MSKKKIGLFLYSLDRWIKILKILNAIDQAFLKTLGTPANPTMMRMMFMRHITELVDNYVPT